MGYYSDLAQVVETKKGKPFCVFTGYLLTDPFLQTITSDAYGPKDPIQRLTFPVASHYTSKLFAKGLGFRPGIKFDDFVKMNDKDNTTFVLVQFDGTDGPSQRSIDNFIKTGFRQGDSILLTGELTQDYSRFADHDFWLKLYGSRWKLNVRKGNQKRG